MTLTSAATASSDLTIHCLRGIHHLKLVPFTSPHFFFLFHLRTTSVAPSSYLQPTIVQLKEPSDLTLLMRMGSGLETGRPIWMNCRHNRNLEDLGPTALPDEIPAENRNRQRWGGGE
ncbi:hypothetical protein HID58_066642 [Brassica napus]|uniref:Uncharacterized protein n=1 Tax=Brassica napus TaxID=3708 RepID=A0ABQ7ZGN8_BRANA|nr:hypothetical protein HID58_066642 [Brassica napus]